MIPSPTRIVNVFNVYLFAIEVIPLLICSSAYASMPQVEKTSRSLASHHEATSRACNSLLFASLTKTPMTA